MASGRVIAAILLFYLAQACSAGGVSEPELWQPPLESGLAYRITLSQIGVRSTIAVEMVVRARPGGDLPQPFDLIIPSRWAGFDDHELDLGEIVAVGGDQAPVRVRRRPGAASLEHSGERELRVRYEVIPRARSLTESSRFHAVGAPELFFAMGRNVFVRPRQLDPITTEVVLELRTGHPNTVWVTTLGAVGEWAHLSGVSLQNLLDAAFCAGRPRLLAEEGESGGVILAADPTLPQLEDRLFDAARRIDRYQSAVFGDLPWPHTVVIVLRRADDGLALTGTGRPGGFVLELGDLVDEAGIDVAELIAHESLHRYVGMWLRFDSDEAVETLWFKEGVVEYLAAQTVVRSGLAQPDDFLSSLSHALTGYYSNRGPSPTTGEGEDGVWHDRAQRRQPYERGFLLAFWLDAQLRQNHDRLDRAVADLVEQHGGGAPIGTAALGGFLQTRLDRDLHGFLYRYTIGRNRIPVSDWLEQVGLVAHRETELAPYYGVEANRDRTGRWQVTAVDPMGPAARLSLRTGDQLMEPPDVPTSGGSRPAQFVVSRGGVVSVISVRPVEGERTHWVVEDTGAFGELMGW